jgi:hypothetical protein
MMSKQHVGLNNGVVQMKKLLITVAAYIPFLLAPTAATPATIVETFAIPFPFNAPIINPFPIQLLSTNIQQFNPALGTLNDVQLTLTGSFRWFPRLDATHPPHELVVSTMLSPALTASQTFLGIPVTDDLVPVTLNLMGTSTNPVFLNFITGTSFVTDELDLNLFGISDLPDQVSGVALPGSQLLNLQGTVTYDYTPNAAVPEPATWAMMLLGFAGLGFAFRHSARKRSTIALNAAI